MSTLYLSADLDFSSSFAIGGFGYAGIPESEYVPPDGSNYLRATLDVPTAVASPFNRHELEPSDLSGGYEHTGYMMFGEAAPTTEASGPVFAVYTYFCRFLLRFVPPPGMSGLGKAYVKVETSAPSGVEYIGGGGAGYAALDADLEPPRGEFDIVFHSSEESTVTVTVHFVGASGPNPPTEVFWTDFIGSHEII